MFREVGLHDIKSWSYCILATYFEDLGWKKGSKIKPVPLLRANEPEPEAPICHDMANSQFYGELMPAIAMPMEGL